MRGERDFEAYVAARSATVLRCLLLLDLDLDLPEAEDTATAAFAALRSDWHELIESADPDVVLWSTVLSVETRRRRRSHREQPGEATVVRVLREVAALEELQVCEVLGLPQSKVRAYLVVPVREYEDDQPEQLYPVPYTRVRAVAWQRRRHRWLLTAGVAVLTAAAVGLGAWLNRPQPVRGPGDQLSPAATRTGFNPTGAVWWVDGELHLPTAVVRIPDVRRLVAAGSGAAYVDSGGRLVAVRPDGTRRLLGQVADGSALVSAPERGLVAWVDVSLPELTRLVVWDVEEQHRVAAVVTQPSVRPITFDAGWLRFGQGLLDWAWDPAGGPAQLTGDGSAENPSDRTALVDAVAGTRMEQWGTYLRIVRAGRRGDTTLVGFGGSLSPDGRFVLTGPQQHRPPRLLDARTGDRVEVWEEPARPLAATFTGSDRVTWLVDTLGDGQLSIVRCSTSVPIACSDVVSLGRPERALLAGDSRR